MSSTPTSWSPAWQLLWIHFLTWGCITNTEHQVGHHILCGWVTLCSMLTYMLTAKFSMETLSQQFKNSIPTQCKTARNPFTGATFLFSLQSLLINSMVFPKSVPLSISWEKSERKYEHSPSSSSFTSVGHYPLNWASLFQRKGEVCLIPQNSYLMTGKTNQMQKYFLSMRENSSSLPRNHIKMMDTLGHTEISAREQQRQADPWVWQTADSLSYLVKCRPMRAPF